MKIKNYKKQIITLLLIVISVVWFIVISGAYFNLDLDASIDFAEPIGIICFLPVSLAAFIGFIPLIKLKKVPKLIGIIMFATNGIFILFSILILSGIRI